jgi:hypothetical protein
VNARTFSLAEVAAQVLPPEWTDAERWLRRRLNRGEIGGYRVGRDWRMTEADVEDLINRHRNGADRRQSEEQVVADGPVSIVDGLSARSRRRLRSAS